jgi:endonuclease/exonuclease/phosphatase (EEP) superfamily protein YafD
MQDSSTATPASAQPAAQSVRLRGLLEATGVVLLVASPLVFLGRHHFALELVSHFRVQLAVMLLLFGVSKALQKKPIAVAFGAMALMLGWPMVQPAFAPSHQLAGQVTLRVLQLNVHTSNQDKASTLGLIRQQQPDLIALEEVDDKWIQGLAALDKDYPYQVKEIRRDNFGIALFSRLPLDATAVQWPGDTGVPTLAATVQLHNNPVRVWVTHPTRPDTPYTARLRDTQLQALALLMDKEPGPVVLAGDLNATPWSPIYADLLQVGRLDNPSERFWSTGTWPAFLPVGRIWIDHVLAGHGAAVVSREVLEDVGSDHLGVLAVVGVAD